MKTALSATLKLSMATLSRKEKSHIFPAARANPGNRAQFYPKADVLASIRGFRVEDRVNGVDFASSCTGIPDAWLTVLEVADILGVCRFTVLRWCRSYAMPHFRFGPRCIRFIEDELRAWVRHQETTEGAFFWAGSDRKRDKFTKWCDNNAPKA